MSCCEDCAVTIGQLRAGGKLLCIKLLLSVWLGMLAVSVEHGIRVWEITMLSQADDVSI